MNLEQYGITIERTPADGTIWRLVDAQKLSGDVNRGKHNAYVYVYDEDGIRVEDIHVRIGWKSHTGEGTAPLDKSGINELGHGDVPLWRDTKYTLWIADMNGYRSDVVHGVHTGFEGDGQGNSWHHNSFRFTFKRSRNDVVTPPPDEKPPTGNGDDDIAELRIRVAALEEDNRLLRQSMQTWIFGD